MDGNSKSGSNDWSDHMKLTKNKYSGEIFEEKRVQNFLDRGIDDMEAGRELPLDRAFEKINELRKERRFARV